MGEDILSVIFLVLICIVISGIAYRLVPGQMMIPTFALIAVCLWISLDYMLMKRHKAKAACANKKVEKDDIEEKINELTDEMNFVDDKGINDIFKDTKKVDPLKPETAHKNEFDINLYDKELTIEELHKDMGCTGDTKIANRMKYMGLQERMSHDIRAKWNVEKFRPYVEEELHDNETRDWWDNETAYLDNFM